MGPVSGVEEHPTRCRLTLSSTSAARGKTDRENAPMHRTDDELRPEYDFRSLRGVVQGNYVARYRERVVRLAQDVAAAVPG